MTEIQDYSYLYSEPDATEAITASQSIPSILMGHKAVRMIDGVACDGNKYSCEGFPRQNLESFIFAPLVLNGVRRLMYASDYDANNAQPPDCQSLDGVKPMQPLTYNGQVYQSCSQCPLFGFTKANKCRNKGLLAGVAYFPNDHGELVLFRKDIPGGSMKALNNLVGELNRAIEIDGERRVIPAKFRWVKATIQLNNTQYGLLPAWNFQVLPSDHNEEGYPPFVPPEFAQDFSAMQHSAMQFARMDASHTLTAEPSAAALTGKVEAAHDQGLTVAAAEADADY